MVKCTKCGKELPDSARFCPECGNAVSQVSEAPKAIPITQKASTAVPISIPITQKTDDTMPIVIPVSQKTDDTMPISIPVSQKTDDTMPISIPVSQKADADAPKAIPITQKADANAPKAIPITQKASSATSHAKKAGKKQIQADTSLEQSKAPADPFDALNKLLGKSGKKILTAIIALITAIGVCIGGFFILKDYKGGIGAILSRVEKDTEEDEKDEKEEKEENTTHSQQTNSPGTTEPEDVTDEPETEAETIPDIYTNANGAGSYTFADGDAYIIAIGETIDFQLPEQNVDDDYYSIFWTVSDQLVKTRGFNNSHNCSIEGAVAGEGYVTAQISWYDENWEHNSYEITVNIFVTETDADIPDNTVPDHTRPDNYPDNIPDNHPDNYPDSIPDDTVEEVCTHCSGQGTVACTLCKGTGYIGSDESRPCTHPQCNNGQKDCPYC